MSTERGARERTRLGTSLALIVFLGVWIGPPDSAWAADCDLKEQIFWADEPGAGWRTDAYGTMDDIRFTTRDTANCDGTMTAWSTAHITGGGRWGDWVEVGWRVITRWAPRIGWYDTYEWFSEWGVNFRSQGGRHGPYPCAQEAGSFHRWRVTNRPGTNDWNVYVNCLTGEGYVLLDTLTDTGHHRGTPTGETGRRGGTDTGMSDRHRHLKWKDSAGGWNDWVDPTCRFDDASNWQGVRDSATEYHTAKGDDDC
ncbi:MAG: hypothetical protein KatS3mg014_2343 [Actinomycetota bacterium]|nr:MAG: hypothetical protein KatS3mg014_2343 [Actinomycetota bacterium]